MEVRDGVEADARGLATLSDLPVGAAKQLLHDRTVRVIEADNDSEDESNGGDESDGGDEGAGDDGGEHEGTEADTEETGAETEETEVENQLRGFVAFAARPGTVHVTQLAGDEAAVERLLEEPVRFARREGMGVEIVVPTDASECDSVEEFGFDAVGSGPAFEGATTRRYRYRPE